MPRLNPYERFTFRNLAEALAAGPLDPAFAQSIYESTMQGAQARAAQQQQILLGLQQMAYEQAAAGMPSESTAELIDAMSGAYPFLSGQNPYSLRQQGVLEDTLSALYPEPVATPNPMLQAGATPSELRGANMPVQAEGGGQLPVGDLIRNISGFLPDFVPGSQVGELEAFAPQIIKPILDAARVSTAPAEAAPAPQQQLPEMAGTQPVMGADGLSPLYTIPHQQQMADAATQAALENQQALDLAAGQGQIQLGLQAQGLPLEVQRAQALAGVETQSALDATVAQAQLERELPGILGPEPLSEEERSSIGQLVAQRVQQGVALSEIRREVTGLTVGMDPARAQEAEKFTIQAWSQITGSTQAENTQVIKLLSLAMPGQPDVVRRLAGVISSNPELRRRLPAYLAGLKVSPAATIQEIMSHAAGQQQQGAGYGG